MNRMILFVFALALTACGTVAPVVNEPKAASWDGSEQNSGLISDVGSAMTVTPHWRDRYNALIAIYGTQFKPALTADEGITARDDSNFSANHFARVHFFEMNLWDHSAMHQAALKGANP
jgi:hypothetical protein